MIIHLEVAHDKNKGMLVQVGKLPFVLGRDPSCHLRAASRMISLKHCEMFDHEGRLYVRDLGSTNGTFVNGNKVSEPVELSDGDLLRVGPLAFNVKMQIEIPVDMPTPLPLNKKIKLPDDDEVAALLLEMMEAHEEAPDDLHGSTIVLPPAEEKAPEPPHKPELPHKPQPAAKPAENSVEAAKAILGKYARRDRK